MAAREYIIDPVAHTITIFPFDKERVTLPWYKTTVDEKDELMLPLYALVYLLAGRLPGSQREEMKRRMQKFHT